MRGSYTRNHSGKKSFHQGLMGHEASGSREIFYQRCGDWLYDNTKPTTAAALQMAGLLVHCARKQSVSNPR